MVVSSSYSLSYCVLGWLQQQPLLGGEGPLLLLKEEETNSSSSNGQEECKKLQGAKRVNLGVNGLQLWPGSLGQVLKDSGPELGAYKGCGYMLPTLQ